MKTAKVGAAVTNFEHDAENKLVRVVSPSNTANYKYDGLGRRVEKQVIAGTTTVTKYVYDNEDILLELNGSNQIVARYTHGPGKNDQWVQDIIKKEAPVYLASPTQLWDAVNNRPTVLAREIQQLESAGYKQIGDYPVPPGW